MRKLRGVGDLPRVTPIFRAEPALEASAMASFWIEQSHGAEAIIYLLIDGLKNHC